MPWQTFRACACCHECAFLEVDTCRLHGQSRRLCDGQCPDRMVEPELMVSALSAEEQARCARLSAHPVARFPFLTLDEMRRLLWYQEYFGTREHQPPTRRFPRLNPHEYRAVKRFIHPDAA